MALDTIAELAGRAVAHVVIELLFVGIFYWPGWLILRVVTIGRYPPPQTQPHNREFVAGIAFAVFIAAVTFHFSGSAA
jgi:hypothetical protein